MMSEDKAWRLLLFDRMNQTNYTTNIGPDVVDYQWKAMTNNLPGSSKADDMGRKRLDYHLY